MKKLLLVVLMFFFLTPVHAATILDSGWENSGGTGCGLPNPIYDNGQWNADYGPPTSCSASCSPWSGQLIYVTDTAGEVRDGTYALEFAFPDSMSGDCSEANGPDPRIESDFAAVSELYLRFYVKWSSNFRWVGEDQDQKVIIMGPTSPLAQNIYFQTRGNAGGTSARMVVHVLPQDVVFGVSSGAGSNIQPNTWYCWEIHVVTGTSGSVEVRLDGVQQTLTVENGSGNPSNLNMGGAIGYIKIDGTYNNWASYVSTMTSDGYRWHDAFVANDGDGWVGLLGAEPITQCIIW